MSLRVRNGHAGALGPSTVHCRQRQVA